LVLKETLQTYVNEER